MQALSITFCNCALLLRRNSVGNRNRVNLSFISSSSSSSSAPTLICRSKSKSQTDSLRVLEWDKLCDVVASFARTSLGRQATKVSTFFSKNVMSVKLLCFKLTLTFLMGLSEKALVSWPEFRWKLEAFGRNRGRH